MKKFLMFDLMITPWIIRILYAINQVIIIIVGLFIFFKSANNYSGYNGYSNSHSLFDGGGPLYGLLVIIGGSLVSRLFFEMLMVMFKISENTSELKELMSNSKVKDKIE
jgi:hypothetical protein